MTKGLRHVHMTGQAKAPPLKDRRESLDEVGKERGVCPHTSLGASPDVSGASENDGGEHDELDSRHSR